VVGVVVVVVVVVVVHVFCNILSSLFYVTWAQSRKEYEQQVANEEAEQLHSFLFATCSVSQL